MGDGGQEGLEGSQGIRGMGLDWMADPVLVADDELLDAAIDVTMQRRADGLGITHGVHQGEVPFHNEIAIVPRRGAVADLQVPEQMLELVRLGQIVVVLQGGKP